MIDSESWGSIVVLSSKKMSGVTNIKSITINDNNDFKIEANMRQDDLVRR